MTPLATPLDSLPDQIAELTPDSEASWSQLAAREADPLVAGLLRRISELEQDSALLDWLETFLQAGSAHAVSTRHESEKVELPDDDDTTRWRNPFSVGLEVETEHRGCYRWAELAKGEKRLREALTTARSAWEAERAHWFRAIED